MRDTPAALAFPAVGVDDGSAQRSMVSDLTVRFDGEVSFDGGARNAAAAFELTGPAGPVALSADLSDSTPGQTVVRLTPTGPGVADGSLGDGNYTLTVLDGRVFNTVGNPIESSTTAFHRLFGDGNGDRTVDTLDLFRLYGAFGTTRADAHYSAAFDADANGSLDSLDLFRLYQSFGTILAPDLVRTTVGIGDGSAQRSVVGDLTVSFDNTVRFVGGEENAAACFELIGPYGLVALSADLSGSTPGQTVVRLTPTGPGVTDGSLDEGNYTLTVVGSRVLDIAGNPIESSTTAFHRLFGDGNGDRTVDALDFFQLRTAFGMTPDAGHTAAFDWNADGATDTLDLFCFYQRFGHTMSARPA